MKDKKDLASWIVFHHEYQIDIDKTDELQLWDGRIIVGRLLPENPEKVDLWIERNNVRSKRKLFNQLLDRLLSSRSSFTIQCENILKVCRFTVIWEFKK
ncbi:MAG: hypothetical protein WC663_01975 [Patescibacteria group bacterium]